MDATWLLERYVAEYNRLAAPLASAPAPANGNGSVARLLALFSPDAQMTFDGLHAGEYFGAAEIGRYFRDHPPTAQETVSLNAHVFDGEHAAAAEFRRAANPTKRAGTLAIVEHSGYIAKLTVTLRSRV